MLANKARKLQRPKSLEIQDDSQHLEKLNSLLSRCRMIVCLDMAFFLLMICYEDRLISISQLELIDIDLSNSWEMLLSNN